MLSDDMAEILVQAKPPVEVSQRTRDGSTGGLTERPCR